MIEEIDNEILSIASTLITSKDCYLGEVAHKIRMNYIDGTTAYNTHRDIEYYYNLVQQKYNEIFSETI